MTDEQLQQLAALAEAATPGRWIAERGMGVRLADYTPICMSCEPFNVDANMAFIAAARQAVPELLADINELQQLLAEMHAWLFRISLAAGADDATPAAILAALTE